MGMMVLFKKTGYNTGYGYIRKLWIEAFDGFVFEIGRGTFLAKVIEKYIIKEDFLFSKHKLIHKEISDDDFKLLKAMKLKQNWMFYFKALDEKWSKRKLKTNLLWKVL